jgi:hypothetical protein
VEFDNEGGLTPEDPLPPIDQPPVGPRLDRLYIYFPYGEGSGTLTTREQAAAITVSPAPDNHSWFVSEMSSPSIGPYWILFPKHEYILGAHESVRFLLEGVTTFNPPGLTHMKLKKQVTGYQAETNASTLLLLSDEPPRILNFASSKGNVASGATIDLSWQTWNAESCELRPQNIDDLPAQMAAYPVRVLRDVNFSLTATSPSGKTSAEATRQVYVDPVRIDSFEASPLEIVRGLPVALRWESYSARSLLIEPGVGLVCENAVGCSVGERVVYPDVTTEYRLTATGEEGPVSKSVTVEVHEFAPFPEPPFPDPVTPLVADTGAEWAEKLLGIEGWRLSSGVFDPAGQFVASRGMTNQQGLQSVVAEGPYTAVDRLSYIAVAGPGAPYVDVAIYPGTVDGQFDYQGWNGQEWVNKPAVAVDGYYWYRLAVVWSSHREPKGVFYAKDYRVSQGLSFQLWAYQGVETQK